MEGSQLSMMPVSRETPFCSGPRQSGQSNGSGFAGGAAWAAGNPPHAESAQYIRVAKHPPNRVQQFNLMSGSREVFAWANHADSNSYSI
jgi:hypothetical protein